jgi:osmotically inducible protein OsmC
MAKVLYTANAHVTGGRENGHGRTADGELEVETSGTQGAGRLRRRNEPGGTVRGRLRPLDVSLPSVSDRDVAAELVRGAHQVCPYSNATRGNIDVDLLLGGEPV